MAVTVAQIIEAARGYHASLDAAFHTDRAFLGLIDSYHKRLVNRVVQINPGEFSTFQNVSLPLADFDAGVAANDFHKYLSGKAFFVADNSMWDRLELIDWELRSSRVHFPAFSILNGTIRLHGVAADWTRYSSLEIRYVPMVTTLAAETSSIVLPDTASDCMGLYAAYARMRAQPDQPYKAFLSELRAEWQEAERIFLGEIAARKQQELSQVREVW